MTAYSVTRPEDHNRTNGPVVVIPSRAELLFQNERLKEYLEAARVDVDKYRRMWEAAHNRRMEAETRTSKALRVLASVERFSPLVAALVERGRVEVYGRLP